MSQPVTETLTLPEPLSLLPPPSILTAIQRRARPLEAGGDRALRSLLVLYNKSIKITHPSLYYVRSSLHVHYST